jgi:hypothetical protein
MGHSRSTFSPRLPHARGSQKTDPDSSGAQNRVPQSRLTLLDGSGNCAALPRPVFQCEKSTFQAHVGFGPVRVHCAINQRLH